MSWLTFKPVRALKFSMFLTIASTYGCLFSSSLTVLPLCFMKSTPPSWARARVDTALSIRPAALLPKPRALARARNSRRSSRRSWHARARALSASDIGGVSCFQTMRTGSACGCGLCLAAAPRGTKHGLGRRLVHDQGRQHAGAQYRPDRIRLVLATRHGQHIAAAQVIERNADRALVHLMRDLAAIDGDEAAQQFAHGARRAHRPELLGGQRLAAQQLRVGCQAGDADHAQLALTLHPAHPLHN